MLYLPCRSEEEYFAAVRSWQPQEPWPVPPNVDAAAQRFEHLLSDEFSWDLGVRPGIVMASGGGFTWGSALLLATVTGRELRVVGQEALADGLTAAVGRWTEVQAWAHAYRGCRGVGIMTGRSDVNVNLAVLKSLRTSRTRQGRSLFVFPGGAGSAHSDGISASELRVAPPVQVLDVRSHGRWCCAVFPDGVVCGRQPFDFAEPVLLESETERLPACVQGDGCFRDLTGAQRIPADELDAEVVILESCRAFPPPGAVEPSEMSVALTAYQGNARAVIAAVGNFIPRGGDGIALALLAGKNLSEAVGNFRDRVQGLALNEIALLGDPAMTLGRGSRS